MEINIEDVHMDEKNKIHIKIQYESYKIHMIFL